MATLFKNFVSSFGFEVLRALNVFRISILFFVILAIGAVLIGLNASRFDVCIFLDLWAGIARHDLSFEFSCPTNAISAMSDVAYFAAQIRFKAASVEARSIERWEYVRAIGLFGFLTKRDRAADV